MSDRTEQLAGILERAKGVHAVVAEKTGGADPDWALFYAWWLLNWSDFTAVLGRTPSLAELTVELTRLDEAYRAGPRRRPWPRAYAESLLDGLADRAGGPLIGTPVVTTADPRETAAPGSAREARRDQVRHHGRDDPTDWPRLP